MGILKDHAGGKFLKSDDIFGVQKEFGVIEVIKDFTESDVSRSDDPTSEIKPILHFMGDLKPMVLNTTNLNMILALFHTDDESKIIGQKIGIYVDDRVSYQGKLVKGLRLCHHDEVGTEKKTS
jgi:hypothetical protein